jgi:transcription initiation factor IIE alpha subunit
MLGWMHEDEAHRGFLELPSGEAMTEKQISLRIGRSLREVKPILAELKSFGVFSVTPVGNVVLPSYGAREPYQRSQARGC